MKKIIVAVAMLIMGGFTLSTVSQANAAPIASVAAIGQATQLDSGVEKVTYKHKYYPKGYYKGFCKDYYGHWWCKKHYGAKYYGYRGYKKHYYRGKHFKKHYFKKHYSKKHYKHY